MNDKKTNKKKIPTSQNQQAIQKYNNIYYLMNEAGQDFQLASDYNFQKTVASPPARFSICVYVPS